MSNRCAANLHQRNSSALDMAESRSNFCRPCVGQPSEKFYGQEGSKTVRLLNVWFGDLTSVIEIQDL